MHGQRPTLQTQEAVATEMVAVAAVLLVEVKAVGRVAGCVVVERERVREVAAARPVAAWARDAESLMPEARGPRAGATFGHRALASVFASSVDGGHRVVPRLLTTVLHACTTVHSYVPVLLWE
jgi:hypothetical protein